MDMEKQTSDEREQYTRIRSIKLIAKLNYKYPSTPISLGIPLRLLKIFSRKIRLLLSIRGLDSPGKIGDRLERRSSNEIVTVSRSSWDDKEEGEKFGRSIRPM